MRGLIQRLRTLAKGDAGTIRTSDDVARFIGTQTAFVAQKVTFDHLHAYLGFELLPLRGEAESLQRCRWGAYKAVLGDMTEVVQIYCRHQELHAWSPPLLAALASRTLHHLGRSEPLEDWDEVIADIERRLAAALLGAPHPVRIIGEATTTRVIEALPLRRAFGPAEREVIRNSISFQLCRSYADLELRADPTALARAAAQATGE
jgi:hypothetical protein